MEELYGGPGSSEEDPTDRAEEEDGGKSAASMDFRERGVDWTEEDATVGDRTPDPARWQRWLDPVARGRLPAFREGQRARGVLHTGERAHALESGYQGPSRRIAGRGVPGFNNITLAHVEGHAAAIMRIGGIRTAILEINRVPCQGRNGCEVNLGRMLPPGARLHVFGPDNFFRSYVGDPDR